MGMYDQLKVGQPESCHDQLKCWDCLLTVYHIGDGVPPVGGETTYSIDLNGAFLIVREGVIAELAEKPLAGPVFDKWGDHLGEAEETFYEEPEAEEIVTALVDLVTVIDNQLKGSRGPDRYMKYEQVDVTPEMDLALLRARLVLRDIEPEGDQG